jgi:hypothetical protein
MPCHLGEGCPYSPRAVPGPQLSFQKGQASTQTVLKPCNGQTQQHLRQSRHEAASLREGGRGRLACQAGELWGQWQFGVVFARYGTLFRVQFIVFLYFFWRGVFEVLVVDGWFKLLCQGQVRLIRLSGWVRFHTCSS